MNFHTPPPVVANSFSMRRNTALALTRRQTPKVPAGR